MLALRSPSSSSGRARYRRRARIFAASAARGARAPPLQRARVGHWRGGAASGALDRRRCPPLTACRLAPRAPRLPLNPSQLRKETYSRLTPTQRLQVARHPNRPTCLDIILNITDKFVELHGDRAGLDDPAIVCGIGSLDGKSFMFIGQQKGRNTKARARATTGEGGLLGDSGG
jgi:hypothetical protein